MNPNRLAKVLALFLGFAGIMHFASPSFFNEIVPPWLPPNPDFWTYISGIAEIAVAIALIRPSTRRAGANRARVAGRTGFMVLAVCGTVCCLVSEQLALSFGFPVRV